MPQQVKGFGGQRGAYQSYIRDETGEPYVNLVIFILSAIPVHKRRYWMMTRLPRTYRMLGWHAAFKENLSA
jgi:hypothetical protein